MHTFIGRKRELARLKSLLNKRSASFVVIRGRRRIGKSRLIQEFGHEIPCHVFSGLAPSAGVTRQEQLDVFTGQMEVQFGMPRLQARDWGEVFWHVGRLTAEGPVLLALDEISWIGSKDHNFLGQLKNAWDLYFSKNPKLILVVCGSVSSWIEKNILSGTGFVGRVSRDMRLTELPLDDAAKFWDSCRDRTAPYEILKVLSVTGGIPRYLEEISPHKTADANIRELCFDREGFLFNEFDKIFLDLFSKRASTYAEILQSLTSTSQGMEEVGKAVGLAKGGTLSSYLNDLVQAGFIAEDSTWNLRTGKISNLKRFRLADNYMRFYLRYVLPHRKAIENDLYENVSLSSLPNWESTIGLQFENLVLHNVHSLLPSLNIQSADVTMFGPFFQRPTQRMRGCQIDLLIQTRYRNLFLCEIKFSIDKVGLDVVEQMTLKHERLVCSPGWSKRLVLIHVNGITQGVRESQKLDHVVDFADLLEKG